MTRYFSEVTDRYFNQWITLSTWDSRHPLDMQRFYQFLKALKRYSRKNWTTGFFDKIVEAAKEKHPFLDEDYINEMAHFFTNRAEAIYAYESASFPDPVVEMRNPYKVSLHLRSYQRVDEKGNTVPLYTSDKIKEILVENFGKDWQNKYR